MKYNMYNAEIYWTLPFYGKSVFVMLFKVILLFLSVNEILKCVHSNET